MTSFTRAVVLPLLMTATAFAEDKAPGLSKDSPFKSANAVAGPAEAAAERIEFAGVSTVGKRTDLIFYDKTTKKSHWIAKGETKEGISVVNYDERREQAFVKINGADKILPLRKGATTSGAGKTAGIPWMPPAGFAVPSPAPAVDPTQKAAAAVSGLPNVPPPQMVVPAQSQATPPPPAAPEAQAQQKAETEARMLVSDLLEIGMAQRKAYEEAQRKAAEGGTPNQNPPGEQPKE